MLRMVLEALQAGEQRRGTSVVAIKVYILRKYPTVDAIRLKYLLKRALDTGMQRGLFVRPTNSKARGATGSFKVSLLVGGAGVGERKQKDERDSALFLASVCYSPARGLFPPLSSCSSCVYSEILSPPRVLVYVPRLSPHTALVTLLCLPPPLSGVFCDQGPSQLCSLLPIAPSWNSSEDQAAQPQAPEGHRVGVCSPCSLTPKQG